MDKNLRATFARKMIHADYWLDDPLFGPVFGVRDRYHNARLYLRQAKAGRSRFIGNRVLAFVNSSVAAISVGGLGALGLRDAVEGSATDNQTFGVILVVVFLLLGCSFTWSALKSHSWIRWMARNWNAPTVAPRTGITSRKRSERKQERALRSVTRAASSEARLIELLDIAREWFVSEFMRKHVRANYQPGDSLLAGQNLQGWIRQYPEEYLSSAKWWRAFMIGSRLVFLGLALAILDVLRPSNFEGEFTLIDYYSAAVVGYIALGVSVGSQSFLRWMIRNWNADRETYG